MDQALLHNERELLARIADGDETAFRCLHHHYWNEIYSLSVAFLKSPDAAEDIVQDVFVKLWIKRASLPQIENFRAFLLVSVRNELISALRKLKKFQKDHSGFLQSIDAAIRPPHYTEAGETASLVREALNTLSAQQQKIFRMSREDNLSHEAIAQKLNLSKKTVSNTITIVLAHIRSHLFRNGGLPLFTTLSIEWLDLFF